MQCSLFITSMSLPHSRKRETMEWGTDAELGVVCDVFVCEKSLCGIEKNRENINRASKTEPNKGKMGHVLTLVMGDRCAI